MTDDTNHVHDFVADGRTSEYHWSLNRLTIKGGKATTAVVQEAGMVLLSYFNFDTCISSDGDLSAVLALPRTATTTGGGLNIKAQFYSASRPGAVVSFDIPTIIVWVRAQWATVKPAIPASDITGITVGSIAGCDENGFFTMVIAVKLTKITYHDRTVLLAVNMFPNAAFNAPVFTLRGTQDHFPGGSFEFIEPVWPGKSQVNPTNWPEPSWPDRFLSSGGSTESLGAPDFKGNTSFTGDCFSWYHDGQFDAAAGNGNRPIVAASYLNTAAYPCSSTATHCDAEYPAFADLACTCDSSSSGCCDAGNQLKRPTHALLGCRLTRIDFSKASDAFSVASQSDKTIYTFAQPGLTSTSKTSWMTPYDNSFVAAPMPYVWDKTASAWTSTGWWIVPTVAPSSVLVAESHTEYRSASMTTEPLNAGAPIHGVFLIDFKQATPVMTRAVDFNAFRSTLTCGSAGSAGFSICASGARFTGGGCSRLLWKEVSASCDGGAVCAKVTCDTTAGANWAFGGASPAALYARLSGAAYGTLDLNGAASGNFAECTCAKLR